MRSSLAGQKLTRGRRIALGLAPHVDPNWAEEFAVELRLLGVAGARIGDVLGEVNPHCQESKESATQAFGDPADYARSLAVADTRRHLPMGHAAFVITDCPAGPGNVDADPGLRSLA